MRISTKLILALAVASVKADLFNFLGTQIVEGCSDSNLKVFITKCVENEVLLKSNKKIYYYQPPKEGEDEVCNRTMKLKETVAEECAPVQLFDEPAITSITSFSNEKFKIAPYLDISCELEDDKKTKVKDCKSWLINEENITIGDITTTDKNLVGKRVKATLTLNIRPDEVIADKIIVFSYNAENGFIFDVNGESQLTMSEAEFDLEKTYGFGAIIDNDTRNVSWSFLSKLKKEGEEEKDKVYAIIDAIGINGATVLTVEDAKKEPVKKPITTIASHSVNATSTEVVTSIASGTVTTITDDDKKEKTTEASSDEESTETETAKSEKATETLKSEKTNEASKTEKTTETLTTEKTTETSTTEKTTETLTTEKTTETSTTEKTTEVSTSEITKTSTSISAATSILSSKTETDEKETAEDSETETGKTDTTTQTDTPTSTVSGTATINKEETSKTGTTDAVSTTNVSSTSTGTASVTEKEKETSGDSDDEDITITITSTTASSSTSEAFAVDVSALLASETNTSVVTSTVTSTNTNDEEKTSKSDTEKETSSIGDVKPDQEDESKVVEGIIEDTLKIEEPAQDADQEKEESSHAGVILLSAGFVTALFFYMKSKKTRFSAVSDAMREVENSPNERFDYFAEEGFLDDYDEVDEMDEMYDEEIGINVDDEQDFLDENDTNQNQNLI